MNELYYWLIWIACGILAGLWLRFRDPLGDPPNPGPIPLATWFVSLLGGTVWLLCLLLLTPFVWICSHPLWKKRL